VHEGLIDSRVKAAQDRVADREVLEPDDWAIVIMRAYHAEEYSQGVELRQAVNDLTIAVKALNGNGNHRGKGNGWRGRTQQAKQAAPTFVAGSGLVSWVSWLLWALK